MNKSIYLLALSIVLFSCKDTKTEEAPVKGDNLLALQLINLNRPQWKSPIQRNKTLT
jgi:hypothetical protein